MIQKNPKQTFPSFIPQSKKLTDLLVENQRLESELYKWKQDYRKLQGKYQKSLKQLALIVKANETLKKDYDELQLKIDSIVQQKAQITRSKIKQYIKKQIDDLNKTIHSLNDEKDQLEIDNNSLNIKVKTLGLEKNKILKDKEEYQRKYNILEAQLQGIDPEARDQNAKSKSVKNLKEKARLVDELQQAVHKLEQEKQWIQKDFDEKLNQIQSLWHQWYEFQHQMNKNSQNNQIKLHDSKSQPSSSQKDQQKSPSKKHRRKGSIIYEHGIKLIRGDKQPQKGKKKQVHFIHELEQANQRIQQMKQKLRRVQEDKQNLLKQIENLKKNQKLIQQLKTTINKLKEEKQNAQQKVSQLRIQLISKQATEARMNGSTVGIRKNEATNVLLSPDQDLVSILKDLHSQLSPLRSQLLSMKRQQSQQSQITSTEKANIEVKLIRLEKQLTFYKDHNEVLKKQLLEIKSQKQLITEYESKINELETEKSALQGKLIVMQTLKVADRTRVEGDTFNLLKQFQKRMQILAHDSTIIKDLQGNHLQQLIAMKAYILQLDERMKMLQLYNEKITKKYAYVKQKMAGLNQKIRQVQNQQAGKLTMYRQKISAYDKLVSKLTAQLQKNIERNSRLTQYNNNSHITSHSRKQNNGKIITTTTQQQQYNPSFKQSSTQQFNKIMNLYEQKMMNMGEQIVRIRKDRDDFQEQVKELRYKLNVKIRELNEKQRQMVLVKMEVIGLQNQRKVLEKEVVEMRAVLNRMNSMEREHSTNSKFDRSKFASTIVGDNILTKNEYNIQSIQQPRQTKSIKQTYQSQIKLLTFRNQQLQQQIQKLKLKQQQNNRLLLTNKLLQKRNSENIVRKDDRNQQNEYIIQAQINKIRREYQQQQLASVQIVIQKHNQLIDEMRHNHCLQMQQKEQKIQRLQRQLKSTEQNMHTLEIMKLQLEQICQTKDEQIYRLQQAIVKNNYQITQLKNIHTSQSIYGNNNYVEGSSEQEMQRLSPQYNNRQQYRQEQQHQQKQQSSLKDQNMQLHNELYEKNVKITSLEAVVYNLKLQKQRILTDYEMLNEKMQQLQQELKTKTSQLNNLQSEVRSSSNIKDSTIMAKDSLIRSYQNEIQNLKWTIDDLKGINVMEKEQLQRVIEGLRERLEKYRKIVGDVIIQKQQYSHENENQLNVNVSGQQQHLPQASNHHQLQQQPSSSPSSQQQQIQQSKQSILTLKQKITHLQSQLKYTQQQLLSSQQINRLLLLSSSEQNSNNNININRGSSNNNIIVPSSNSSIMSMGNYEKMEMLQSQVLLLRTNILSLQNEIEYKEQVINQLRQDVFNMKMQYLKGSGNGNNSGDNGNSNNGNVDNSNMNSSHKDLTKKQEQVQIQHVDRSTSPRRSPIFMITDQPIVAGLEYRIGELIKVNQELQRMNQELGESNQELVGKLAQKQVRIGVMQTEIQRLNQQLLGGYRKEEEDKEKQEEEEYQQQQEHHDQQQQKQRTNQQQNQQQQQTSHVIITQQKISHYQQQINQLHNTIRQYETQILNKNIKISQLNRQLVQYRLLIGGSSSKGSGQNVLVDREGQGEGKGRQQNQQKQQGQQINQRQQQHNNSIEYLLQQIQRQQLLLKEKQHQLTDIQTLLTKYQSQQIREKQNLSLIFLLMVEIQALRNQLIERIKDEKRQKGENLEGNKIQRVREESQENKQQKQQNKVDYDYSVIKGVQCSHQHLVNYQKMVMMKQRQQQKQQQQQKRTVQKQLQLQPQHKKEHQKEQSQQHSPQHQHQHPITQTIITNNSHSQLPPLPHPPSTHHRTSSLQKQHIPTSSYKTIDEMKLIEAQSFPSESNSSINNIDSNYSIRNPFKDYYRHAESTYNPLVFSPEKKEIKGEDSEEIVGEIMGQNVHEQRQGKAKHLIDLGSFGKISESHNVESSYGSMGLQSSEYLSQRGDPSQSEYNYSFKNVNMIQSIQSTPNEKGKKQSTQKQKQLQRKQDKFNNFSFGKEEKFRQQPLYYQVESRYVFEKRDEPASLSGISSSGVGTVYNQQPYSSYGSRQNYSSSYLQQYPLTSTTQPYVPATSTIESFPSFNSKGNLINKSNSYIAEQSSQRSGSQTSSNNYIPTYNSNSVSSSTISNTNLNYGTTSGTNFSNLSQNNYNSTLGNTTSTSYQQYMSKFL